MQGKKYKIQFDKKNSKLINIAGKMRLNEWQGKKNVEFIIEDIWGSMAHVSMLGKQKIIPAAAACKILGGLKDLHDENLNGDWELDDPVGESMDVYRNTRDEIEKQVRDLL